MQISLVLGVLIISVFAGAVMFWMFQNQKRSKSVDAMGLMQQQIDSLRNQLRDSLKDNSQVLQQQIADLNNSVNKNLQAVTTQLIDSQKTVGDRLDGAAQVVGQVQKDLGSLSQATARVFEVGKDIASLQEILRAPKIRGGLGELFLEDLLRQILPPSNFEIQYKFKSGAIVDSVIRLGERLVSVDSKFPLENFKRIISGENEDVKKQARRVFKSDVKKHIDCLTTLLLIGII